MNKIYERLAEHLRNGSVCVATMLSGPSAGEKIIWRGARILAGHEYEHHGWSWQEVIAAVNQSGEPLPRMISLPAICDAAPADARIFAERLLQEPELVICGGGHISLELAALADYLEYSYVILDDREEFCNPVRFPRAKACICGAFSESLAVEQEFSGNAYFVIVTRGHQADMECLELVLQRPYGYVGMIGSRGKVARTMAVLQAKGYSGEQLSRVHAPIGLPIGGQTPKEIAISIAAQLVEQKNREHSASYLDREMLGRLGEKQSGRTVMVTIIDKRGSAPRGTGSRMLVNRDGISCGTIGGGMIEYEAGRKARAMVLGETETEPIQTVSYQVNNRSAAALGMWCGGEVEVMMELL